jgi:integrase
MAVGKRGNKYWMVFMDRGERVQRSTRCTNRRDAEEVERAYRTQRAKGEVGFEAKKRIPRFKEAIKEFLNWAHQEHRDVPNTQRRAETSSKALLRFFEDCRIDQITVDHVEKYKEWRRVQRKQAPHKKLRKNCNAKTTAIIKPATVNRELACLRAMLNYYIRKDVLVKNPVSKVKFFKEESNHMRVLSPDEERLYLMACSQPLQDVATIMIDTGMRPSEVCSLERRHVDLGRGFVFIEKGKTQAARRKIPLSDRALKVFRRRLANSKGDYIFPAMRKGQNQHVIKLNFAHKAATTRAKLALFRIYDLRHTFATRAAEAGVDLVTLAALLGHSRVQMLMRYAHPTEQHQYEAIRRIESIRMAGVG